MDHKIGEIIFRNEDVVINQGKEAKEITVRNTGDRTIQVCSHYHFFECNQALVFEREKTYGMRLDIPSGNAVRFEPGEDKKVTLVAFGGSRELYGFAGMTMGRIDDGDVRKNAFSKMKEGE
jgi:urease subunit beta